MKQPYQKQRRVIYESPHQRMNNNQVPKPHIGTTLNTNTNTTNTNNNNNRQQNNMNSNVLKDYGLLKMIAGCASAFTP